jgi:hypothetical protein
MKNDENVSKMIFEQLNRALLEKSNGSNIIDHNLEKGLGNEQALRELLRNFLPGKYGVAKGKVVNALGQRSRQCDIIIYDRMQCPNLFIDENDNQILPIEGVYIVIEVKTTLTSSILKDAFMNLSSVYNLSQRETNRSNNDHVDYFTPGLAVMAFNYSGKLDALCNQYISLSQKYPVKNSFHSYSSKSPGSKNLTGEKYLVYEVCVLNYGAVYHMLNGATTSSPDGEHTLGLFLTNLMKTLNWIDLPRVDLLNYFNHLMVKSMTKDAVKPAPNKKSGAVKPHTL